MSRSSRFDASRDKRVVKPSKIIHQNSQEVVVAVALPRGVDLILSDVRKLGDGLQLDDGSSPQAVATQFCKRGRWLVHSGVVLLKSCPGFTENFRGC